MSLFTVLTHARICELVNNAKHRVIFAAPGLSEDISASIIQAISRLGDGKVQVVVDVSPQVARLGYGSNSAIERLKNAGVTIRHQSGIRIGILICDDTGWSFASFPALVEEYPTSDNEAYNAIALTSAQVMALRSELPHIRDSNENDVTCYPTVGSDPIDEEHFNQVKNALKIAPPQPFDLMRRTQVYAALIQFVELKFEGFNIQSRRIQLPKSLPLIASQDRALKERVTTSLKVLDKIEKPKALAEVTKSLEELRDAYLISTGQAGRIILKSKVADFEKELAKIGKTLKDCKKSLTEDLQKALNNVVNEIVPDLIRAVLADPPSRFRGLFPLTEDYAEVFVKEELNKAFPSAEELVEHMKIHKFYKDVTYETLKNEEFKKKVLKQIPESVISGALLQEDIAAKSAPAAVDTNH